MIYLLKMFEKFSLTNCLCLIKSLGQQSIRLNAMDRTLKAYNNFYGYWFYTYFTSVCPSLKEDLLG
jgi:hypothetical protein